MKNISKELKDKIEKEIQTLSDIREEFYEFLDKNIEKSDNKTDIYDFSKAKDLDAKEVYNRFFKLDYQARKLRGIINQLTGI